MIISMMTSILDGHPQHLSSQKQQQKMVMKLSEQLILCSYDLNTASLHFSQL